MSTDTVGTQTKLDRWQARRERRYLKQVDSMKAWLPKMRNQSARRKLVGVIVTTFVLFPVSGALLLYGLVNDDPALWVWIPWILATLVSIISWTLLNITIDAVDGAPSSLLDEYERSRIESLRSITYRAFTWVGLTAVIGMVVLGTIIMTTDPGWGKYVPYAFGVFGLPVYLALICFPSLVIAWTMTDDD